MRVDRRWLALAWGVGLAAVALTAARRAVPEHCVLTAHTAAYALVIPLALVQMLRGVTTVYNGFLSAHARGRELRSAGVVLTLSNLGLNFALIPPFGATGAAWASLVALALNLGAHVYYYRRSLGAAVRPATA